MARPYTIMSSGFFLRTKPLCSTARLRCFPPNCKPFVATTRKFRRTLTLGFADKHDFFPYIPISFVYIFWANVGCQCRCLKRHIGSLFVVFYSLKTENDVCIVTFILLGMKNVFATTGCFLRSGFCTALLN